MVKFRSSQSLFFFFNDTATTEIYTLSLHDALPISRSRSMSGTGCCTPSRRSPPPRDRKSTRLNSSHQIISYAVFCLKKKTRPPAAQPPDVRVVVDHPPGLMDAGAPPVAPAGAVRRQTAAVFFFSDTATTDIYTLSLHDALPI